jgi:hypothetical protein
MIILPGMEEGFLPLWRKYFRHPFWTEKRVFSKAEAWIEILRHAQHEKEPKQRLVNGIPVTQNYGEAIMSTRYCGRCWGWTQSRVRRFLILLQNMEQIELKSTHGPARQPNIIIVKNFSTYDIREKSTDSACDSQPTHNRLTTDSQPTQIKERKERIRTKKNGKNNSDFVPPLENEVVSFFVENGFPAELGSNAFHYYEDGNPPWHDSTGKPVKSWKQKMRAVWFKPQNKKNPGHNKWSAVTEQNIESFKKWIPPEERTECG